MSDQLAYVEQLRDRLEGYTDRILAVVGVEEAQAQEMLKTLADFLKGKKAEIEWDENGYAVTELLTGDVDDQGFHFFLETPEAESVDNEYLIDSFIPYEPADGLPGKATCLGLLAYGEIWTANKSLKHVCTLEERPEKNTVIFQEVAFSEATPDKQFNNLAIAASLIIRASELLLRAERIELVIKGIKKSCKELEEREAVIEAQLKKRKSEENRQRAFKRHESTRRLKKKALELYQEKSYPSARQASKVIAPKLREWAVIEELPALAIENEERTISEWIMAHKKQKSG